MSHVIIADTGPLIALARVDLLSHLNKVFSRVIVPETVFEEACGDHSKPGAEAIAALDNAPWFQVMSVDTVHTPDVALHVLDKGELDVILLAKELNCIALLDENLGRRIAINRGVKVVGSAGILLNLKKMGVIVEVMPFVDRFARNGYRLAPSLIQKIRELAGE